MSVRTDRPIDPTKENAVKRSARICLTRARLLLIALLAALSLGATQAPSASAAGDLQIESLSAGISAHVAGGHPDSTLSFQFGTETAPGPAGEAGFTGCYDAVFNPQPCTVIKGGAPKDIVVELPKGLVGNAKGFDQCTVKRLGEGACPVSSQVGFANLSFINLGRLVSPELVSLHNMVPDRGEVAKLGMRVLAVSTFISVKLERGGDYALVTESPNIFTGWPLYKAEVTAWGVPNDPVHDPKRHCYESGAPGTFGCSPTNKAIPFMVAPAECGVDGSVTLRARSYQHPTDEDWVSATSAPEQVEGCDKLSFKPRMSLQPTSDRAASPTGLDVDLTIPQHFDSPASTETPPLRKAVVTLPEGVSVNPSSSAGLGACSMEQIGIAASGVPNGEPVNCPDSAKIGSLTASTPVLDEGLTGSIYLARQNDNPFDSLLALYLVVENPERGILVKLPGKVDSDPSTGRLTATFDDNPQLPVGNLTLHFKSGPRAPLITPRTCGAYASQTELTSWGGQVQKGASSFQIASGPNGGPCPDGAFYPKLNAGTTNPLAGAYSPFVLNLSREDGTQELSNLNVTLPKGLLAKLAGIPYCSDAALAGVSEVEGTGQGQLASPSCPSASQIGSVSVGAGAGPSPFYVTTGKAYLAGPYKGAPLSMAFVTPAVAGPFDLGSVVVRAALQVNPVTAEITAVSDPLPRILHGIPLDLRDIRVNLDRPQFTLNPTSCEPMAIGSTITGTSGATASPSSRFQVASCERLPFAPKLALRVFGKTKRNAKPRFRAVLQASPGEANIARAQVNLPHSEFLEQNHIRTVCTRVQWNAGAGHGANCPPDSVYGHATAFTPLLDKPLEGPVYLRSSSNKLPDLVAALNGQVDIELAGKVDSGPNEGIRNTFEVVPDAPVTKFVLEMEGGKKGLLVNSENLCSKQAKTKAIVRFTGQNGKVHAFKPKVANACGAKHKKRHPGKSKK